MTRYRSLSWLVIIGAVMLLAGVLMFCHAELRGAHYIEQTNSFLDELGDRFPGAESDRIRREEVWDSFSLERLCAYQVLAPLGVGILAGALLLLAVATRWQFKLRTLVIATLYLAVLIGVPFGTLRPRLHQPRLWVQYDPPGIYYQQHSMRVGGGPGWSFPLVSGRNVLVAMSAAILVTPVGLLAILRRRTRPSPPPGENTVSGLPLVHNPSPTNPSMIDRPNQTSRNRRSSNTAKKQGNLRPCVDREFRPASFRSFASGAGLSRE